ncbi:cyclopropane-fatty-acyl-phospholipid synthase family protein [Brevundimonas sp.]|uniref:SAM-dependent methyltransferase n=1 Tax=Brevundimonas sp. TaxID=1871086 RepID=UPI001A224A35|nr:cyclopropane-fatty-acyl-phospholipid synthase family protein [Brevundimonas sp.]MBJ7484773.1 class I SAM-dependent methyltransferase [Brevundimonas sp.]
MTAPLVDDAQGRFGFDLPRPNRILLWAFRAADKDWQGRGLTMVMPDRQEHHFGPPSPDRAVLEIRDWGFIRRIVAGGAIGLAESYMADEWRTPDLARTLIVLADNFDRLGKLTSGNALVRAFNWVTHNLGRMNTRAGSKKNIVAHYDLGNDFYSRWLDPSMTYSSALWTQGSLSLEQAQHEKYAALARSIDLQPHHRVLEIGCGWGGFAEYAAREIGCSIVGLTLSPAQQAFAIERMAKAGLSDRVEIRLQDYRDTPETFDRIVSIEMFEAVGEQWWPTYFKVVRDRLVPGGRAGLQIITIRDDLFEAYRREVDFIQKYVFPGGMLPSEPRLNQETAAQGLVTTETRRFGADYARTLALWLKRFDETYSGMDATFDRLWRFYLAYCEAGFSTGRTDVVQVSLVRPN